MSDADSATPVKKNETRPWPDFRTAPLFEGQLRVSELRARSSRASLSLHSARVSSSNCEGVQQPIRAAGHLCASTRYVQLPQRATETHCNQGCSKASPTVMRSCGSGVRARRMKSQHCAERSSGQRSEGGGQVEWISSKSQRCFMAVARCGSHSLRPVLPGPKKVFNKGWPTSTWYSVTPADHTSTCSSCGAFRRTSGAMYWKVPARDVGASWVKQHHPKSAIFKLSPSVNSKLSGLISRCKKPKECTVWRPKKSWRAQRAPCASVKRCLGSMCSLRNKSPSSHSSSSK
mmetsp:Transcript_76541/g.206358  ORF Transcript_76541/g.206358 Transcript_76541/m.206358 type:complete len:289 (-) Transcript_76541:1247-2113(-)